MIIARFQFKPDVASRFCVGRDQSIVEVLYDDIRELVRFCKQIEDDIIDCVVLDGNRVISLKSFST